MFHGGNKNPDFINSKVSERIVSAVMSDVFELVCVQQDEQLVSVTRFKSPVLLISD